jgi:hypothetical protein
MEFKHFIFLAAGMVLSCSSDESDGDSNGNAIKIGEQIWMAKNLNVAAEGSMCYENKDSHCATYGRLYNWETAKIVCPKGWHLPTQDEWRELDSASAPLFRALLGGSCSALGFCNGIGNLGFWWSRAESGSGLAYAYSITSESKHAQLKGFDKTYLYSVRCVKDKEEEDGEEPCD